MGNNVAVDADTKLGAEKVKNQVMLVYNELNDASLSGRVDNALSNMSPSYVAKLKRIGGIPGGSRMPILNAYNSHYVKKKTDLAIVEDLMELVDRMDPGARGGGDYKYNMYIVMCIAAVIVMLLLWVLDSPLMTKIAISVLASCVVLISAYHIIK